MYTEDKHGNIGIGTATPNCGATSEGTMEERLKYKYKEMKEKCEELLSIVTEMPRTGTFFGATGENVIDLITEYEIRGGTMPMTSESITKAFKPDKIRIGTLPGGKGKWPYWGISEQKRAQPGGVLVALYKILPLDDVMTDYEGTIRARDDLVRIRNKPVLFKIPTSFFNLTCDNSFTVPSDLSVEKTASKIAQEIMTKHLYRWKAFAAHIKYRSEGYLEVIYGVLEKDSKKTDSELRQAYSGLSVAMRAIANIEKEEAENER